MNRKRVYRLYIEEGLQITNKQPKRKVDPKLRDNRHPPTAPNQVCSIDFLLDQLFGGSMRIRAIAVLTCEVVPVIWTGWRPD
jgi:putative transposase